MRRLFPEIAPLVWRLLPAAYAVLAILIKSVRRSSLFGLVLAAGLIFAHWMAAWLGATPGLGFRSAYSRCGANAFLVSPPGLPDHLPVSAVTYSFLLASVAALVGYSNRRDEALYNFAAMFGLGVVWLIDVVWLLSMPTPCYGWRELVGASAVGATVGWLWMLAATRVSANPGADQPRTPLVPDLVRHTLARPV